ncbi:MAG TPA: DUF2520 domain-containing protein [Fredinandcohnia sp.]|nr:DUF2520 domain-containing protein [Fredinandcohnia sp.]
MERHADIVGFGRIGEALAVSLTRAGWTTRAWSPSLRGRATAAGALVEGPRPEDFPSAPVVFLAVSDAAVAEVAANLPVRPGQVVAHLSGALGLDALAPAAERGAEVGSLHPLVAVPSGQDGLPPCFAAVEGSPRARAVLEGIARALGLRPFSLPPEGRAAYHAAASLAANGLVALESLAVRILASLGLRRDEALAALLPLVRSAVDGLERRGLPGALTGPVARGDASTVRRHLDALAESDALATYRALFVEALRLARELGEADPARLDAIAEILAVPDDQR